MERKVEMVGTVGRAVMEDMLEMENGPSPVPLPIEARFESAVTLEKPGGWDRVARTEVREEQEEFSLLGMELTEKMRLDSREAEEKEELFSELALPLESPVAAVAGVNQRLLEPAAVRGLEAPEPVELVVLVFLDSYKP